MRQRSSILPDLCQLPAALIRGGFLFFWLCCGTAAAQTDAGGTVDRFVAEAFAGRAPAPAALWFTPALKAQAREEAGFVPDTMRLRYWRNGNRTAWVIDRIGKEEPITFGVIVENDAIVALQVLVYRESRGHEIRSPRWLAQFAGARTKPGGVDRRIDNVTGATLSVRAGIDVARLALFCHRTVTADAPAVP
ncbi:MAG: FMN-binding protein [Pseudomonadota bacterium]